MKKDTTNFLTKLLVRNLSRKRKKQKKEDHMSHHVILKEVKLMKQRHK